MSSQEITTPQSTVSFNLKISTNPKDKANKDQVIFILIQTS